MPPERANTCAKGHNNWAINRTTGERRCRTCRNSYNKAHKAVQQKIAPWSDGKRNTGNRGGRLDTFSRTEIMKARGYA